MPLPLPSSRSEFLYQLREGEGIPVALQVNKTELDSLTIKVQFEIG